MDAEPNRSLTSLLGGVVAGVVAAAVVVAAWSWLARESRPAVPPPVAGPDTDVSFFRGWDGDGRSVVLLPAGPDARGEPALSSRVFPDEQPPRQFASLLLANVHPRPSGEGAEQGSDGEPPGDTTERPTVGEWQIDLGSRPVRARREGGDWTPLEPMAARAGDAALSAADRTRLRALGATSTRVSVEAGTLRSVLLALPAGWQLTDVSDVQWGDVPFEIERLDLERVHRLREDPAGVLSR